MGKILIHIPPLTLFGILWISWGNSHISIGPCWCDGLTCWVILTGRLRKWGRCTVDYRCRLSIRLIKWPPVPFIELGQARRSVPPLYFSHSSMKSLVSGRLGFLLLPNLLVIYLSSIVRKNVLTGPPCIPRLWLIYPCYLGEPHDLTSPPCVWWIHLGCPFWIPKGLPSYPW